MKNNVLIAIIALLLVGVLIFGIFNVAEILGNNGNKGADYYTSRIIERDGKKYYPRQDITTLLFVGIDRSEPVTESEGYRNDGRADFISVLVFNKSTKTLDVLQFNRDTMCNMQVLGENGYPAGSAYGQLAFAHTYGKGLKDSSENMKKTVSDMLNSLEIDYYVTINVDVVADINDMLGGVTVNVTDDFSATEVPIPMGTVTLNGKQAVNFIRNHLGKEDNLSNTYMKRQNEYMKGLWSLLLSSTAANKTILLNIYDKISEYTVTDISTVTLAVLAERYSRYQFGRIITPKGESREGEEFMEFHLDSADFDKIVLDLFYIQK